MRPRIVSLNAHQEKEIYHYDENIKKWKTKFNPDDYKRPIKLRSDLINSGNEKIELKKGSKINYHIAKKIFDDGLIYEGVWTEPKQFRGQTGAQDNIIPMEDIFTGVINFYPDNQLTKYLLDLRRYRPKCIQDFFVDLKLDIDKISSGSIFHFLKEKQNSVGMCYLLAIVEEIYKFRNGHWQFVQKYIMSNTKYAKATGGTPIISWIPNQIKSVLNFIEVIIDELVSMKKDFNDEQTKIFNDSLNTYKSKKKLLDKQLIIVSDSNYNPGKVFELNKKFKLEDSNFEKK